MPTTTSITEAGIIEKIIAAADGKFDAGVAQSWLQFRFDGETTRTIRNLLQKNNRGTISANERLELEKYLRVGKFLDLLHARAKLALRGGGRKS